MSNEFDYENSEMESDNTNTSNNTNTESGDGIMPEQQNTDSYQGANVYQNANGYQNANAYQNVNGYQNANAYQNTNGYQNANAYQNVSGYQNASAYQNTDSYHNANAYQSHSFQHTNSQPKPKKKKKGGFGKQLAKVACFGLVFGVVAGGTMWGVNSVGNMLTGQSSTTQTPTDSNGTFTLNIVKTSSQDVETIEGTGVADIVEQAKPAIIAVSTVVEKTSQDFFGRTYSQEGEGAGSGIIFSEENGTMYLMTNYHVIKDSKEVSVTFVDDSSAPAIVKGFDESQDIAVLAVNMSDLSEETKNTVKIAVLGDSDSIKEGDGAIAIGNALGYGQSTTTGTISAVNREVQMTDGTKTMIQTDAAINEGNSGGALLNTKGEVIGINSAKLYGTTVEGMGYAIPINVALETVSDIMSGKLVNKTDDQKASLGIYGGTINEAYTETYGWPAGVYVSSVINNSAAQRAGLTAGCIITGFNGEKITTMEELQDALLECSPGDQATIEVMVPDRDGNYTESRTLTTLLGSAAETNQNASRSTR